VSPGSILLHMLFSASHSASISAWSRCGLAGRPRPRPRARPRPRPRDGAAASAGAIAGECVGATAGADSLIFIEEAPVSAPPTWPLGSSLIFFDGAVDRGLLLPVCGSVLRLAAAFGPFAFAVVVAVTSWNGEGCPGSLSFNDFEGCSCPDGATRLAEDETFSFSFSLGGSSEAMAASVTSSLRSTGRW